MAPKDLQALGDLKWLVIANSIGRTTIVWLGVVNALYWAVEIVLAVSVYGVYVRYKRKLGAMSKEQMQIDSLPCRAAHESRQTDRAHSLQRAHIRTEPFPFQPTARVSLEWLFYIELKIKRLTNSTQYTFTYK